MAELDVRVAGTWRKVSAVHVRVAGSWRACKEVWVKVSGTWQKVYTSFLVSAGVSITSNTSGSGATQAPQVWFNADGTTQIRNSDGSITNGTNWGEPPTTGIGASYWINVAVGSGNATVGGTVGSWLQLNVQQSWSSSVLLGNSRLRNLSYQIATDSSGSNAVSGSILLTNDGT
jgi:hypothetical protein